MSRLRMRKTVWQQRWSTYYKLISGQFPTDRKYSAASNGVFHPRGSRQISVQARLLGLLLAEIKDGIWNS